MGINGHAFYKHIIVGQELRTELKKNNLSSFGPLRTWGPSPGGPLSLDLRRQLDRDGYMGAHRKCGQRYFLWRTMDPTGI